MKKVLMSILAMVMVSGVVKAQFSSSNEVYAYIEAGKALSSNPNVYFFIFSKGKVYFDDMKYKYLCEKYREDPSLSYLKSRFIAEYDRSNSTNKRETYHRQETGSSFWGISARHDYFSFSMDRESLIKWTTSSKSYYQRVEMSNFAPKTQNKDFLYE